MIIIRLIYNLLLIILYPLIMLSLFIINFRRGSLAHFGEYLGFIKFEKPISSGGAIWFHAASVGEVRSIISIIERIRKQIPDIDIVISTMTVNGRDVAKDIADHTFLLPIENTFVLKNLISILNAKIFFIVDTELWPNLIFTASENSKVIMINARISDNTFESYKKFKPLISYLLKNVSIIFTKSEEDTLRYKYFTKDVVKIETLGNIKFNKRKLLKDIKPIEALLGKKYIVASSTHNNEEELFINAFMRSKLFKKVTLIIAPRHINRADEIKNIAISKGLTAKKLSEDIMGIDVIIIDKFGVLEPLYAYAEKIFIGGSIAKIGGHNIFEALQFEKNISCGRNLFNFKEIQVIANKFNLLTYLENEEDIVKFLNSDFNKYEFKEFFKAVEDENKSVVEKIVGNILK